MIYMDNAATTIHKPKEVVAALIRAMNSMGNAGRGAHEEALDAARTIYSAREKLRRFFGAHSAKEIAFTMNATESLNIAIKGILQDGDHVVTTVLEHNSVLRPLYEMQEKGVNITFVKSDDAGNVSYEEVEKRIQSNTKAIICTGASNLTGNIIDLKCMGEIAKRNQVLLVVDASQLAGIYPIHVQDMNIDILCFTGHKSLLGPQGTGGLYVREGVDVLPLLSGGSGIDTYSKTHPALMPTRLEAGTLNGHGIAGLEAAVDYIESMGLDVLQEKEMNLMWQFYQGVRDIPSVKVYGDFQTKHRCPIVALNVGDYDSSEVSDELLMTYHISTRPGAHCAPLMHEALGTKEQGAVRFSFSYANTQEEVQVAIDAIRTIAEES
jgi:cysteine desulfurase family protein